MAVSPRNAALSGAGVTLVAFDYGLLTEPPIDSRAGVAIAIVLSTIAVAGVAALAATIFNLAVGDRPRIRRRR